MLCDTRAEIFLITPSHRQIKCEIAEVPRISGLVSEVYLLLQLCRAYGEDQIYIFILVLEYVLFVCMFAFPSIFYIAIF